MKTIKAKELDISSVMVDQRYIIPVIKTEDIPAKGIIYLVLREKFEKAEEEEEIYLALSQKVNGQIRNETEGELITFPGLLAKKGNLTIIE